MTLRQWSRVCGVYRCFAWVRPKRVELDLDRLSKARAYWP